MNGDRRSTTPTTPTEISTKDATHYAYDLENELRALKENGGQDLLHLHRRRPNRLEGLASDRLLQLGHKRPARPAGPGAEFSQRTSLRSYSYGEGPIGFSTQNASFATTQTRSAR